MPQLNLCAGGQYSKFMAKSQNIVSPKLQCKSCWNAENFKLLFIVLKLLDIF